MTIRTRSQRTALWWVRLGHGWVIGASLLVLTVFGSCGGGGGLMTLGEYCSRIAGPTCDRAINCAIIAASGRSTCLADFQSGCCGMDGTCGDRANNASEQAQAQQIITECSSALMTFDCTQLANGNAPLACGGTSPSAPTSGGTTVSPPSIRGLGFQAGHNGTFSAAP